MEDYINEVQELFGTIGYLKEMIIFSHEPQRSDYEKELNKVYEQLRLLLNEKY